MRSHLSDLSGLTGTKKSHQQIVVPPEALQPSASQAKNLDLTDANVLSSTHDQQDPPQTAESPLHPRNSQLQDMQDVISPDLPSDNNPAERKEDEQEAATENQ